jgi:uncharacterized protein YqeY
MNNANKMSKLLEKIKQDLKQAMLSKDVGTTSALRMLVAALHNKEISLRQDGRAELTDEQVVEMVSGEIKKRREAAELYARGGREELADKENEEIKILERYLPAQLSDQELERMIKEIIASGASNFSRVMGQTIAKTKGRAEGSRVSEIAKRILAK